MFEFFRRLFRKPRSAPQPQPETVPYFDFDTKITTRIPKTELSSGAILVRIEGHSEPVYVDGSSLKASNTYRHGPFDAEIRSHLTTLAADLEDVYPMSPAQWEDGFRKDTNPEREIAGWIHVAAILKAMSQRFDFDHAERQECFKLLVACYTGERHTVRERSYRKLLAPEQVDLAIQYFYEGGYE